MWTLEGILIAATTPVSLVLDIVISSALPPRGETYPASVSPYSLSETDTPDAYEVHNLYFDVLASSDSCDPTSPLCIVSPQCELYTWEEYRGTEDRWQEAFSVTHVTRTDISDGISSTGWGLRSIYKEVSHIFEEEGEMQLAGNHGNVPTKSQHRSNAPVQRSSIPVSTSSVTPHQKSSSPGKSQQRTNSPSTAHQRSSSPANFLQRSSSPVSSQQISFSPVRYHERSSSPVRSQQINSSPLKFQQNVSTIMSSTQKSFSSMDSYQKNSSPVKRQQRSTSPMRPQQRSTSPVRTQLQSTSILRPQQRSASPVRTQPRATSPVKTQPRSASPVRSQASSSSPFRDQQRSVSPISLHRSTSPARSQQRSAADVGQSGKFIKRSSIPKTANVEPIHKNCAQRGHMDVSHYGTDRVASQSVFSSHSPSRIRQDPQSLGVSRRLTSSTSSLESECSPRGTSSLIHYTTLADIPRAKSLKPDFNRTINMKARTRSPGKAEVERMFGEERRTAEALEAFQALEAGLIESLSGKNTVMERRRARRQSTPCLYPEESVRMRQELKLRRASLHPPPRMDMGFSSSQATGTKSRDSSPHRVRNQGFSSSKATGTKSRDSSPHRAGNQGFSSSQATGTKSRDSSPHRAGNQGRTAFPEPEWINRDKILRPVGTQDKKEENLDKTTELAWTNRETFLKSSRQTSVLRTSAETPHGHSCGSQYQQLERPHKLEQQYKPAASNNPDSHYMGSNHAHQTLHHLSPASLSEQELMYTQTRCRQETKNHAEWSLYKPAGPLSYHTPQAQNQHFLGYHNGTESPLSKIALRANAIQTDWEMSPNVAVSCPASSRESGRRNSQGLYFLPESRSQNVQDAKFFPPESESKAHTPPEPIKREFQRVQTPPPNTTPKSFQAPHILSPEPIHCDFKELQILNTTEIIRKDVMNQCSKTSSRTEYLGCEGPPPQHTKNENSQTKAITEFHHSDCHPDDRNPQQTHHIPPASPSEQEVPYTETNCRQEMTNRERWSQYKPAGPLSCYRPEPQPQHLLDCYSGTESPLSKVVLKPTRTHTVQEASPNVTVSRPASPQEPEYRNSQGLDTLTKSRSQNVWDGKQSPPEPESRAHTPPQPMKRESQKLQTPTPNIIQRSSQRPHTPSPEPNLYTNTPDNIHRDFWGPCSKTSPWTESSGCERPSSLHLKNKNAPTKGNTEFHHREHSPAGRNTPDYVETCDIDMYLNTTAKHIKPDLLNFKKGWMSLLDGNGEWKKHWFVLTDSSLRYYRDSNAEEADELDGEIDLRTCTDVPEFAVQRNYGFQIHTNEGVFTLSAMTSGIRRNWIEALRKNVHPVCIPDVTKLSESNKENTFVPSRHTQRPDELRLGSEVRQRKVELPGSRHGSFDYVELSPLSPGEERDQRSEERRRWFEAPSGGDASSTRRVTPTGLSEEQKQRLNEDIEAKWKELERLPLRETKQTALTCLLGASRSKTGGENTAALEKQVQSLKMQLEKAKKEIEAQKGGSEGAAPHGFISQEACENSLSQMEKSHKQLLSELQRHHEWEIQRLRQEKDQLLSEETAATASVIEAIRAAHKEELQREVEKARTFQHGGSSGNEILRRQHQSDMEALRHELQTLSERYSQKCLEIGALNLAAGDRERDLQRCQQEGQELLRQNQELNSRLSEEISKLRSFMAGNGPSEGQLQRGEKSSTELEVLLRVKENELQYLQKEVSCLREDLQNMQKDKRYASEKYKDIYVELNNIKSRSEREIDQLKEHLRLAMAALREEAALRNSVGE